MSLPVQQALTAISPARAIDPLTRALRGIINRLVALDPEAPARLHSLIGRSVCLYLSEPALTVWAQIAADASIELELRPGDGSADLNLRTSPGAILRLLATGSAGIGQLKVEGDAELARELQKLAQAWRPDLDGLLSRGFGEVAGFQLARAARGLFGWARQGVRRLSEQSAEYLREESRDVLSQAELDAFLDEVDELRASVERVERRVQRVLAEKRKSASASMTAAASEINTSSD